MGEVGNLPTRENSQNRDGVWQTNGQPPPAPTDHASHERQKATRTGKHSRTAQTPLKTQINGSKWQIIARFTTADINGKPSHRITNGRFKDKHEKTTIFPASGRQIGTTAATVNAFHEHGAKRQPRRQNCIYIHILLEGIKMQLQRISKHINIIHFLLLYMQQYYYIIISDYLAII